MADTREIIMTSLLKTTLLLAAMTGLIMLIGGCWAAAAVSRSRSYLQSR